MPGKLRSSPLLAILFTNTPPRGSKRPLRKDVIGVFVIRALPHTEVSAQRSLGHANFLKLGKQMNTKRLVIRTVLAILIYSAQLMAHQFRMFHCVSLDAGPGMMETRKELGLPTDTAKCPEYAAQPFWIFPAALIERSSAITAAASWCVGVGLWIALLMLLERLAFRKLRGRARSPV